MSGQYCLDANIFIAAWYKNYLMDVLPSLWEQLSKCQSEIILIKPIFDEIEPVSPSDNKKLSMEKKRDRYPLRMWMESNRFDATDVHEETNVVSLALEKEYEISSESKGAGQKDMTLIAYAKLMDKTVVTFEAKQLQKPEKKYNYKIPLICQEHDVECIDFMKMLQRLNISV